MVILKLTKSILRPFKNGDEASIVENGNNIKIWRNVRDEFPHPYTLEDAKNWILMCQSDHPHKKFAIDVNGKAVGGIGLNKKGGANESHQMEIGFWLGENYWGRGIISEAVPAIIAFGFDQLGLQRIEANCYDHNPASKRVLEKSGFELEGCAKGGVIKEGKLVDVWRFGILNQYSN